MSCSKGTTINIYQLFAAFLKLTYVFFPESESDSESDSAWVKVVPSQVSLHWQWVVNLKATFAGGQCHAGGLTWPGRRSLSKCTVTPGPGPRAALTGGPANLKAFKFNGCPAGPAPWPVWRSVVEHWQPQGRTPTRSHRPGPGSLTGGRRRPFTARVSPQGLRLVHWVKRQPARARPGTTLSLQVASAALRQSPSLARRPWTWSSSAITWNIYSKCWARNSELQVSSFVPGRLWRVNYLFKPATVPRSAAGKLQGLQPSFRPGFRPGRCDIQYPKHVPVVDFSAPIEGGKVFQAFHSS